MKESKIVQEAEELLNEIDNINEDVDQEDTLREFPTLQSAMKDSFFYRIENAASEIFHIIKFLEENTSDTKTRSDMKRILNGALNNLLLIQEIVTRSIREENILINTEEDNEFDDLLPDDTDTTDAADDVTADNLETQPELLETHVTNVNGKVTSTESDDS